MWKLTITQKRKSEFSENMITENVEFVGNDINELTMLVVRLAEHENAVETAYKIERVAKEGGENE